MDCGIKMLSLSAALPKTWIVPGACKMSGTVGIKSFRNYNFLHIVITDCCMSCIFCHNYDMYVVLCAVRRYEALTGIVRDVQGCATCLTEQGDQRTH